MIPHSSVKVTLWYWLNTAAWLDKATQAGIVAFVKVTLQQVGYIPQNATPSVSFQSKRLRRSVEPRRDAGRRDLGTRVQDSIVVSKYLSPKPERHMGRSLQRNIFDRLRTLQGRNPKGAPRPLFPLRIPPSNRAR